MGSDRAAIVRRALVPFLAGAAAAAAWGHGLYATATVALLIATWAAALIGRAAQTVPTPSFPLAAPPAADDAERRRLRLYLDLSPAPLVSLDTDDRLRAVNRAARRLFAADDLLPGAQTELTRAIREAAPGEPASVRVDTGDGDHAFAIVTGDVDGAGGPVRVAALVDIEADLRAAEAATLADLIRVLSHEVTNTLTPIASLSETAATMLDDPAPDLAAVRDATRTVARRARALQRFGEAYRDVARLPPPRRERFDLAALAGDLARLFTTRWPDVRLRIVAPATLTIGADPDQLAQGLWALLQNAAEAGGDVTMELARFRSGATITVADGGPGVAPEDAEAIFRPFFTTKPEGSGVGLSLTRQIFRLHGGDLTLVRAEPSAIFRATV